MALASSAPDTPARQPDQKDQTMKRTTKRTLKDCCISEKRGRAKTRRWSNTAARSANPDSAHAAIMDLIRSRLPLPLALYETSKSSTKFQPRRPSIPEAYGYWVPFYMGPGSAYIFGLNPDPDGLTNISTTEQAIHITGKTPPPEICYVLT